MLLGDFHIHSNFSDGQLSISQIVDVYGSLGFDVIAITDHICETSGLMGLGAQYLNWTVTEKNFSTYINTIRQEAERAWFQYQMLVLPGFELTKNSLFSSRSAHILALGTDQFVSANLSPIKQLESIRNNGGLTIAAHPVDTGVKERQTHRLWNMREEIKHLFDAWEVASGSVLFQEVRQSGLPLIANSDMHKLKQVQSWKTLLDCEKHPEAVLDAIRNQDIEFLFFNFDPTIYTGNEISANGLAPLMGA